MKKKRIAAVAVFALLSLTIFLRASGYRIYRYAEEKNSMLPTLSPGDICLCVIKKKYATEALEGGMVVLIRHRGYSHLLTKRIIGKEDDHIHIDGDKTYINEIRLEEPYAEYGPKDQRYGDVTTLTVPKNKLFVMGDNRAISFDSRYSEFGLVNVSQVVGKPLFIVWAKDKRKVGRRFAP